MSERFLAAAIQMHAGSDRADNLARALALVEQAAAQGAKLVALPEFFQFYGYLDEIVAGAQTLTGPTSTALSELAAKLKITLVGGTICEEAPNDKGYNACLVFDAAGKTIAHYRKRHLFDCQLPTVAYEESRRIAPGEKVVTFQSLGMMVGLATCYDVRFPEHFRSLADQGMQLLVIPAAFATQTGSAQHWEVLLRARAIEDQVYVIAPNQFGQHTRNASTWGHSLIIDPWGKILAEGSGDRDEVLLAEIDPQRVAEVRAQIPCLAHRR